MTQNFIVINNNIPNKDSINDFLLSKKLENKSPLTIERYKNFLVNFFKSVPQNIKDLTKDDILNWLEQYSKNRKEGTIITKFSILSVYLKYCYEEGYINNNIISNRWKPKAPKPLPKYLERSEVDRIRIESEKGNIRDQALLEFLVSSGCRVKEAFNLNIGDVDLSNRTVKVIGKGDKFRFVHISEYCAVLFEKYLECHSKKNTAFFIGKSNNRLGIRRIQIIIRKLGMGAGLKKSISPHCLRHTFATSLLSKGADIEFIQDELGHSELGTTRIYARLPQQNIIDLYNKFMR